MTEIGTRTVRAWLRVPTTTGVSAVEGIDSPKAIHQGAAVEQRGAWSTPSSLPRRLGRGAASRPARSRRGPRAALYRGGGAAMLLASAGVAR